MVNRIPVQSTNLASVGYEKGTAILEVEFLNGSVYQYFGVPESVYDGLLNAPSKGRYFDQFVKKAGYTYAKIA